MKELNGTIRIITFGDVLIIPYTAIENKQRRIQELDAKASTDVEQAEVAAGVFRIIQPV